MAEPQSLPQFPNFVSDLKLLTARTLKWNTLDRVSSQILYLVVGVVLANILSQEEFGLIGAIAIFQAFATIFVDSGFGAALLREKDPTREDYSTVFWFNTIVSLLIYIILFFSAPIIAEIFQKQSILIPMSRVLFLTFVINSLAIVQTNRLMKMMNVKMIAISNTSALIIAGLTGITLAILGFGAWAMVWYSLIQACVKTLILWLTGHWLPSLCFSFQSLRKIQAVGFSVFSSALLNTISLNIYNFVIGVWYNLSSLGVYTQADKWSKMGSASISQILTSSFVPLLSKVQDSITDFHRYTERVGRFTSMLLFPCMILLTLLAPAIFHLLFGNKWDAAIPLFQLLTIRGIFIVLISLYSNYLLALGKARTLFLIETIKDLLILIAILSTAWTLNLSLLVGGQLLSSILTWTIILPMTARQIQLPTLSLLSHIKPFLFATIPAILISIAATILFALILPAASFLHTSPLPTPDMMSPAILPSDPCLNPQVVPSTDILHRFLHPILYTTPQSQFSTRTAYNLLLIVIQSSSFISTYLLILHLRRHPELPETLSYLLGRFRRHSS